MTNANLLPKPNRVELVDALRGFALLGIILVHSMEHFEICNYVESMNPILAAIDRFLYDTIFFLFGGKCYAIFALMFGFSFYVQSANRKKRNEPFAGRFFWRMCLLILFGVFHLLFFSGDILTCYALVGMLMIPLRNLSNKALIVILVICVLEPFELIQLGMGLADPDYEPVRYSGDLYRQVVTAAKEGESFWDVAYANLTAGLPNTHLFTWRSGRYFQTIALFLAGILLGRKGLFTPEKGKNGFWKKVWLISVPCFVVFYLLRTNLGTWGLTAGVSRPLSTLVYMWGNLFFAAFWVSSFSLLWFYTRFINVEAKLVPFGKMSLSNYIGSSIFGALIYYHYALGLYNKLGATATLLVATATFLLQLYFSRWWLARYKRGPLETVWYRLTNLSFRK